MKHVLLVDDEEQLLLTMQAGFEPFKNQFRIITARNGVEATAILASTPIDLVVTDLKMPEMDGFELLAFLKNNFSTIPAIVMSAFSTPAIEVRLKQMGMIRMLEKPVDFDELTQLIREQLSEKPTIGTLTGISLQSFMQLIEMEQNTCLMDVSMPDGGHGLLYFSAGKLYDAVFGNLVAEEAVYAMLETDDVKISFRELPAKKLKRRINMNLMNLIMEGIRRRDEVNLSPEDIPTIELEELADITVDRNVPATETSNDALVEGDRKMSDMKSILEKFKVIDGFQAVGVFSPDGEMVANYNASQIPLAEIGALANDILLKAQKTTETMGVGRGQMVHVEAPKGHVICRCLNEGTDFTTSVSGRAHLHLVLLISSDGNVALGKMKANSAIQELAEFFR